MNKINYVFDSDGHGTMFLIINFHANMNKLKLAPVLHCSG
jgi:hypothetical protein